MADIIIPDGYAQVSYQWYSNTFKSGVAVTTHGIELGAGNLDANASAWGMLMEDTFLPLMPPYVGLGTVTVISATEYGTYLSATDGGAANNELMAPNTAVLVSEKTNIRGRRGQGRMFLPGLAYEVQVGTDGTLVGAWRVDIQNAADDFLTGGTPGDRPMVILQRETPTGPNAPANPTPPLAVPPPVAALIVDEKVATQRRRLR